MINVKNCLLRLVFSKSSCLNFNHIVVRNSSGISVENMTIKEWEDAFKKATVDVAKMDITTISYEKSAERMRELFKTGLLKYDDIIKRPERFFLAHRLLAYHSPILGPGFWIRFTVHYNLCVGTVVGLGSEEQIKSLSEWQDQGLLGCFSLTEKFAGVNSGLIVNTIAEWNPKYKNFTLHTPNDGAKKNWISQGLVADKTTVIADLKIGGKSFGPHAFMIDLRDSNRNLIEGITVEDMGKKTIGNDLDNASIKFNNVQLPKSSLLNKYADIIDGQYKQTIENMPVFHMIGQRLFTGRVAVAQAALEFRRRLFDLTKVYIDNKLCWSPSGDVPLSSIPQLQALYEEAEAKSTYISKFVSKCESELSKILISNTLPSIELVEAIACAKVIAVEECISLTHRLKNEVGSYALMANTGFSQTDFLQCCKFAEGDSRILMQKMARDRMRIFTKTNQEYINAVEEKEEWDEETKICYRLHHNIERVVRGSTDEKKDRITAWDDNWKTVYKLAEAIMDRIMKNYLKE